MHCFGESVDNPCYAKGGRGGARGKMEAGALGRAILIQPSAAAEYGASGGRCLSGENVAVRGYPG